MSADTGWTDRSIEEIVAILLRVGVSLAALVVFVGAIIYLIRHGSSPMEYHVFHGEPADLRNVRGIFHDVLGGRGRGIIQMGLLLLIATPVARVAFSIFGFAKERDGMYVGFTVGVFIILMYSIFGTAG